MKYAYVHMYIPLIVMHACMYVYIHVCMYVSVPPHPPHRTTMIVRNRFPQENVQKSCKNRHVSHIMCCTDLNDKIIDFLYVHNVDENPMKNRNIEGKLQHYSCTCTRMGN